MADKKTQKETIDLPKWAVVGASKDPDRYSYKIVRILKERGYTVYPVSPNADEVLGLKCHDRLSDLPEKPDVVDMVVNPKIGIEIMKEVRELGIDYVWLQPGSESEEIERFAEENGIAAWEGCILATLKSRPDQRIEA